MPLKTLSELGQREGTVQGVTATVAQLNSILRSVGAKAFSILRVAADVVSAKTVTIGSDVYEVEIINTDSTEVAANDDFANTDNPLVLSTAGADYASVTWTAGLLIRLENEIMRIQSVNSDKVRLQRGHSGTTIASHADAVSIYEGDGVTAGSIPVGMVATLTPAVFTVALVGAINQFATEAVTALKIGDNEVIVFADAVGVVALATTETLAGVDNAWDTATMRGGAAAGIKRSAHVVRVPNAAEVALGNVHIPLDFTPTFVLVHVVATATGIELAWDGGILIDATNNVITLDNDGTVDWATTNTAYVLAIE
jgi:hypothetical protein